MKIKFNTFTNKIFVLLLCVSFSKNVDTVTTSDRIPENGVESLQDKLGNDVQPISSEEMNVGELREILNAELGSIKLILRTLNNKIDTLATRIEDVKLKSVNEVGAAVKQQQIFLRRLKQTENDVATMKGKQKNIEEELQTRKQNGQKLSDISNQLKEESHIARQKLQNINASISELRNAFHTSETAQQKTTSHIQQLQKRTISNILQLKGEIQLLRNQHQRTIASELKNESKNLTLEEMKHQNTTETMTTDTEPGLNTAFIESPPFVNGKVYLYPKLADEKKGDWFKNRRICEKYNVEMVSIHSEEENKFFHNWARGSDVGMVHPGAWLAAQTHDHNEDFTWNNVGVTRHYMILSGAGFNEPGTNCLMLGWRNWGFFWDDWYCDRELFIVCQRRNQ